MQTDADVNAVAIRLPEFQTHDLTTWFIHAEVQFEIRNITQDRTKFIHTVAALPTSAIDEVKDLIRTQKESPNNGYQKLKDRLLERYVLPPNERAAALLDLPALGDQRPSQLFKRMESLIDGQTDLFDHVLKEMFLRAMPQDVRAHLADKKKLSRRELALEADNHFTATGDRVCSVREHKNVQPARQATAAATPRDPTTVLCWFHKKFGKEARKCYAPCAFRSEN